MTLGRLTGDRIVARVGRRSVVTVGGLLAMGGILLAGGMLGSFLGVRIFDILRSKGHFEIVVSLLYVFLLGTIGALMLMESLRAMRRRNDPNAALVARRRHTWAHGLPLKMRFRVSQLYVSAIPPFIIGFLVGILGAVMGVGGGFIMVPAMIYLIGMPTRIVIGTSVFQFLFVTSFTTILQAYTDGVLAAGEVAGTDPAPGASVATDAPITLKVSRGNQFPMPDLTGLFYADALQQLQALGFTGRLLKGPDVDAGGDRRARVVRQDPAPRAGVNRDGTITVSYGS